MVRRCGKRWDGGPGLRGHDDSSGGSQELNLAGAWDTHERCRILSICLRGQSNAPNQSYRRVKRLGSCPRSGDSRVAPTRS